MTTNERRKFGHLCNAFLSQAQGDNILFSPDFFTVLNNIAQENFKARIRADQRGILGTVLSFEPTGE